MTTQTDFRAGLLNPDAPMPEGLTNAHGVPSPKRYGVYRNNVTVSLVDALQTGFPAIHSLLGDQNFRALATHFARANPPQSPLMMLYGADFAQFLAHTQALAHLPYLPDIAALEYGLRTSYHAANHDPQPFSALQSLAPEQIDDAKLSLAPSAILLQSVWPIHDIYTFALDPTAPQPQAAAQDILILRKEFDPKPHLLPANAAKFIRALGAGKTLSQAIENAPDTDVGAILTLLFTEGAIARITV